MSWNIDIPWSLNSSDTFPRRKFENWALTSCRPGPILSTSTISFELHAKVAEEIDLEMCSYGQLSEVQMVCDLDLDLGSGQGHINIHSTCRTTSVPTYVTSITQYRNMAIWISWNIDNRRSMNSRDSFARRKFKNRAPTSCRPGPILWLPTISFELRAKVAEEIDLEMYSYGQLSELQMVHDLDLDLGWGQGHINVHSTCRTSSLPNHVTEPSVYGGDAPSGKLLWPLVIVGHADLHSCTDSQALRAEYCIVGIPHNTAI